MILVILAVIFELLLTPPISVTNDINPISLIPAFIIQDNECSECHDDISIDISVHENLDCIDCHESFESVPHEELSIKMLNDPMSKYFEENIPETCSKCHDEEYAEYIESEHWKAYSKGNRQAPLCNDCHLEHTILSAHDPDSPVSPSKVTATCSSCHANERIINRYGLATFRVESFMSSYHGLAMRRGAEDVANCASCHGVHKILSEEDPESMINPANLNSTCGKCHPGFGDEIVIGKIHVSYEIEPVSPIIWVRIIYLWVITITLSGMVLHNGLDFLKKVITQSYIRYRSAETDIEFVTRFNVVERTIHWSVMITFILLVWTGFSLAYPESSFGTLWSENFRRLLHRIAGVIMIIGISIQSVLMIITKRGRYQLRELFPKFSDARDLLQNLIFYLGLADNRPKFGRYSYIEKVEFWAFMWGSILMAVTGIALWFETSTLRIFPSWSIDFFTAIHFYEAILASLSIVVWHFYWVIFDPDIYPGTGANFHGRISIERLKGEYPKEYKKIKNNQMDK